MLEVEQFCMVHTLILLDFYVVVQFEKMFTYAESFCLRKNLMAPVVMQSRNRIFCRA